MFVQLGLLGILSGSLNQYKSLYNGRNDMVTRPLVTKDKQMFCFCGMLFWVDFIDLFDLLGNFQIQHCLRDTDCHSCTAKGGTLKTSDQ